MSDKIIEDIYTHLKKKRWGMAVVMFAIMCVLVFSVWNSLPDSVKEKYLLDREDVEPSKMIVAENKDKVSAPDRQVASQKLNSAQSSPLISFRQDGKPYRNATQEAQFLLRELGYDVGPPDGFEGPKTTLSIEDFQKKHNLPITGAADEATVSTLRLRAEKAFLRKNG